MSGDTVEQSSDEPRLGPDVAAINVSNLPFPYHRHCLIACQCSTGCPEAAKTESWIGQSFHVPVVLFEGIVQVLHLSYSGSAPQFAVFFHLGGGLWIGGILVHGDSAGIHRDTLRQGLAEEPFRCPSVTLGR